MKQHALTHKTRSEEGGNSRSGLDSSSSNENSNEPTELSSGGGVKRSPSDQETTMPLPKRPHGKSKY